jgi:hypothetical protein
MQNNFQGFHGEWNLGSPGGWEYQKMIQEIYLPAWKRIKELTGIDVELDIETNVFKPSVAFTELMLEKSKLCFPDKDPFIIIMAEEDTLDDVIENSRFVDHLNSLPDVSSKLIGPKELQLENEKVMVNSKEITAIFMDFNTSVLVKLEKEHSIDPIVKAIEQNLMVNPRGMEVINAKGIFELASGELKDKLSPTTVERTPWTRKFHQRNTTGPKGEEIADLLEWTRKNWNNVILKPEHGWSGKGIIVCPREPDIDGKIKEALDIGDYIVQEIVPVPLWSEMMPKINEETKKVELIERQTDFRCLISHKGVVGFLARFGGIPTNVGSGGGVQALAIVTSGHTPGQATKKINDALLSLSYDQAMKVRKIIDDGAMKYKFIYLNGPIPIGLRPRVLSKEQIDSLSEYAVNLYKDTLTLEQMWIDGRLEDYVQISDREKEIARLQPRTPDTPAMIASDGLFNFGSGLNDI